MTWKAFAERRFPMFDVAIHLAKTRPGGLDVVQRHDPVLSTTDEGVLTEPFLVIPEDAARSLYDALGAALNLYSPDARLATETLELEQRRVDKMIDHLVGGDS